MEIAISELILLSATTSIHANDPKVIPTLKQHAATFYDKEAPASVLLPPGGKDCSLLFEVKIRHDQNDANLSITENTVPFVHPKAAGHKQPTTARRATFQRVTNTTATAKGDELMLYRPTSVTTI